MTLAASGTARLLGAPSVILPAGAASATVSVRTLPDDRSEPDETVVLTISPGKGYTVGEPAMATGILVDDDLP